MAPRHRPQPSGLVRAERPEHPVLASPTLIAPANQAPAVTAVTTEPSDGGLKKVTIRLPEDLVRELKMRAVADDESVQDWVAAAVRDRLAH